MEPIALLRFGAHVAFDFVNTVNSWTGPATRDDLARFWQITARSAEPGLLAVEAKRLTALPARATRRAHAEALPLRGLFLRIFGSVIDGMPAPSEDVEAMTAPLAQARKNQCLAPVGPGSGFVRAWTAAVEPRTPAIPVALAAAQLLERGERGRLKRCPPPGGCGWLFLDESRNRSRRWRRMSFCGGRTKARRFAEARRPPA